MTTDELYERILSTSTGHAMFREGVPAVLMVSGGSDSIALLHVMAALKDRLGIGEMRVMHLNHMLRGADADADEAFVKQVAEGYGIEVDAFHENIAAMVDDERGNMENIARRERYLLANRVLDELCAAHSCAPEDGRIVVAHTEDDRTETFFMRTIVGAGLGSLASIPYLSGRVARPLLNVTRDDLREYLVNQVGAVAGAVHGEKPVLMGCAMVLPLAAAASAISAVSVTSAAPSAPASSATPPGTVTLWREDATNADITHFRAFVRSQIVPRAKVFNPQLAKTVCRNLDLLGEENAMLDEQASRELDALLEREPDGTLLVDLAGLKELPVPMQRRVVRKAAFMVMPPDARLDAFHVQRIVDGGTDAGFVTVLPGSTVVGNEYGKLAFRRNSSSDGILGRIPVGLHTGCLSDGAWLDVPGTLDLGDAGIIEASVADGIPDVHTAGGNRAFVDIGALPRLWVRSPRPGERVCPLGMDGRSRKVSDILVDRKVPARLRGKVPLALTGPEDDAESVWLAGLMVDERYRVRPTTAYCVLLTLRVRREADEN